MRDEISTIDTRGQMAPLPLLELKRAMDSASAGHEVLLMSDDPTLASDIDMYLAASGHELLNTGAEGPAQTYRIIKR